MSPVIILGCIYSGIASPTEAAVISVFYALIVSLFIYKTMTFKDIWPALVEGVRTYAPIMFILSSIDCIFKSSDSDADPTDGKHLDPDALYQ